MYRYMVRYLGKDLVEDVCFIYASSDVEAELIVKRAISGIVVLEITKLTY